MGLYSKDCAIIYIKKTESGRYQVLLAEYPTTPPPQIPSVEAQIIASADDNKALQYSFTSTTELNTAFSSWLTTWAGIDH